MAIVTGASRGIGLAIAETFAREGATVVICGRKQETLDQVASKVKGVPGKFFPLACHVGRPEEIKRLVETTHREFGKVDILVNNAATNIAQGPVLKVDEGQFDKMVELNLKSAFRLTQAVPGHVRTRMGVHHQYFFDRGPPSRSRRDAVQHDQGGAEHDDAILRAGARPQGIRVNAIAPGLVQTVLSEFHWKDENKLKLAIDSQPIKHLGQPQEIAEVALLLASDHGSYITGQAIVVDGGRIG